MFLGNSAYAQKKEHKAVNPKIAKAEAERNKAMMQELLPATAKLVIVDSVVADRNSFVSRIPLDKACGRMVNSSELFKGTDILHRKNSVAYLNEFGDRCFYNDSVAGGKTMLFTAEKLGGKWRNARPLKEFGTEYEDIEFPYLMPDGVTLYFSAVNKTKSVGKRDIFMTRLNTDSMTFYKPENVGLPYNSVDDDFCCIIDDINNIGWIVTNRRQPAGKVCIYAFVPTTKRWTDVNANISAKKLEALAEINRIADTWTDKAEADKAKETLARLKERTASGTENSAAASNAGFFFPVNDKIVYRKASDFKSPTAKELFAKATELKRQLEDDNAKLDVLRKKFEEANAAGKRNLYKTIIILEKNCEIIESQYKNIEKKIRNAENLM